MFERQDQSGAPGKEIVIGSAMLPAGTAIGYHTHAGDEAGYVLKGTLILKTRGQPARALNVSDSFFDPLGAVQSLVEAPAGEGGTSVSTWIIDRWRYRYPESYNLPDASARLPNQLSRIPCPSIRSYQWRILLMR